MTIEFYRVEDENIAVPKAKTLMTTLTGTIKEACSISDPVIRIARNNYLLNSNYFRIPEFGRYYFRTDLIIDPNDGQYFIFSGHVDVLDTFWNEFYNVEQVITRQETQFNVNLEDSELPIRTDKKYKIVPIGNTPFNVKDINDNAFYPIILNAANAGTQL